MPRIKRLYRVVGIWPDGTRQTRNYQTQEAAGHRAAVWMSPAHDAAYYPPRAERVELYVSTPIDFDDEPSFVYQPFMWGRSAGGAS